MVNGQDVESFQSWVGAFELFENVERAKRDV